MALVIGLPAASLTVATTVSGLEVVIAVFGTPATSTKASDIVGVVTSGVVPVLLPVDVPVEVPVEVPVLPADPPPPQDASKSAANIEMSSRNKSTFENFSVMEIILVPDLKLLGQGSSCESTDASPVSNDLRRNKNE